MAEKYDFEIGDSGLDYDILDSTFNDKTQLLILKNGLQPGMNVLDVGSGAGVMTCWFAQQVGPSGTVTAIDNSPEQLKMVEARAAKLGLNNIKTIVLSAYDLSELNQCFDVVYCRFLLHHLHSPRKAIKGFYQVLKPEGFYFGQEGIIHSMWSYPASKAWQGYQPVLPSPDKVVEGDDRDGDFGMKLLFACRQHGFRIQDCQLDQPILWTKEQKQGMLLGLVAYKQTALEQGMSEQEWEENYNETVRIIDDPNYVMGFYGSCFVAAVKEKQGDDRCLTKNRCFTTL